MLSEKQKSIRLSISPAIATQSLSCPRSSSGGEWKSRGAYGRGPFRAQAPRSEYEVATQTFHRPHEHPPLQKQNPDQAAALPAADAVAADSSIVMHAILTSRVRVLFDTMMPSFSLAITSFTQVPF